MTGMTGCLPRTAICHGRMTTWCEGRARWRLISETRDCETEEISFGDMVLCRLVCLLDISSQPVAREQYILAGLIKPVHQSADVRMSALLGDLGIERHVAERGRERPRGRLEPSMRCVSHVGNELTK